MAAHTSGFFKAPAKLKDKQGEDCGVINVGGGQFQAAAVALIDYWQSNPQVNENETEALKKVLARLYKYFPNYIDNQRYLTVTDRINLLVKNPRRSELVESMAYVLQQLTVDELYANPLNLHYRDIFKDLAPETPKSYLRDPHTKLPISALKALEKALGLPVTLSFTERDKELRRFEGSVDGDKSAIMVRIHEDKCYPEVKRKAPFTYVGQLAVNIKPVVISSEQEGTLADILAAIAADNQHLLRSYKQQRNTILSQAPGAGGDVDYAQLRDLYIALLPRQMNNAPFIIQLEPSEHPAIVGNSDQSEQQNIALLANSLASWITAGAIKEDELFDRMENTQSAVLAR